MQFPEHYVHTPFFPSVIVLRTKHMDHSRSICLYSQWISPCSSQNSDCGVQCVGIDAPLMEYHIPGARYAHDLITHSWSCTLHVSLGYHNVPGCLCSCIAMQWCMYAGATVSIVSCSSHSSNIYDVWVRHAMTMMLDNIIHDQTKAS